MSLSSMPTNRLSGTIKIDGSMWSDPQPVDNDGTADFSPQLKDVGGVTYLVWENAKVEFDETVTMETMFENMEISVAQYDRGTNTFINKTNLSNDSYLDILPRIHGNDSEVSVVWVNNTGNDIFGLNQQNSIVVSTFDGSSWSNPLSLDENLNAIDDLAVAVVNGTRLIAYTVDMDSDLDTLEDKELFINGIRITEDDVLDSKPVFADGVLYWYSGGSIKYIDDFGTYEIKELLSEAQHIPSDRFQVYKNSFGDSYIVFTRSTGMGSELSALVHDQASGRWSPVIDLTSLGAAIGDFSGFVDDAGTLRIALTRGHLLEDFTEDEDPLASVDLCLLEVSPVYNLSLGNVS